MSTKLFVTGASTYAYRHDLRELGGRWNRDLEAWFLPISRRHQIEQLFEGIAVEIDMYDTATGRIIPLPRFLKFGDRWIKYLPPRHYADRYIQRRYRPA